MTHLQVGEFFGISVDNVLGLLMGGMAITIVWLAIDNRSLKNKLFSLVSTTIEKLTEIKQNTTSQNETLNEIKRLILWVRKFKPKENNNHESEGEKTGK